MEKFNLGFALIEFFHPEGLARGTLCLVLEELVNLQNF